MCNSANGEPHSPGLLRDRGRGDRGGPGSPRGTALQEGTVWGLHDQHPRRMPGVSRVSRGLRLCRRAHGTPGGHPAFLCGPEEATNDPETATRSCCQACTVAQSMGPRHPLSPARTPPTRAEVGCARRGHAGACCPIPTGWRDPSRSAGPGRFPPTTRPVQKQRCLPSGGRQTSTDTLHLGPWNPGGQRGRYAEGRTGSRGARPGPRAGTDVGCPEQLTELAGSSPKVRDP